MSFKKFKYTLINKFASKKKKLLWTLNNQISKEFICKPNISVLKLTQDTNLGKKNERIFVTNDSYQTWYIMNNENFNDTFSLKIKDYINKQYSYNFIDIGANTGLLTKSLINNNIDFKNIYCVEPDEDNFYCLENNLKNYSNIHKFNYALDELDGEKKLYIDENNKGNLSFNFEMMNLEQDKLSFMNTKDNHITVKCMAINKFFEQVDPNNLNIVKIDVQGFDETIFSNIPNSILKKTSCLIIEITPLKSKEVNMNKFREKLNCFDHFAKFDGTQISKNDVEKYVTFETGQSFDLIFSNKIIN